MSHRYPDSAPSRRTVVFAGLSTAGGLAVGLPLAAEAKASARASQIAALADSQNSHPELTAWLVIDPDSTITVRLPHQEMGQGTSTGLAMLVAEELGCDWSKVRVEYASANRNQRAGGKLYGMMTTGGSLGLRMSVKTMQQAGASARERLRLAAAKHWKIDASQCDIRDGQCLNRMSKRTLSYGDLAPAAALVQLDKEPAVKTPEQFELVGKWTARLDTASKLDGSAQFGIDARVPNMVYAAVQSCPEFGGKLASVKEAAIEGRRGIIAVVKLDDAVAVVADRYWRAKTALADLAPTWTDGGNAHVDQATLDQIYRDVLDGPLSRMRDDGDVDKALAAPEAKVVEALYEVPYLAHAPMEPLNCAVHLQPDRADVWIGTQAPMTVLKTTAQEAGIAPENVYVHNHFIGGGFGRRVLHDELVQAIAVAKVVKKPVKLIWHREQDIRRDRYRPQAAMRLKAAIGRDGKPTGLLTQVAVPSILRSMGAGKVEKGVEPMAIEVLDVQAYQIPNYRIDAAHKETHVPVMYWRSVGSSQNAFFFESFIDELAHEAGADPYRFRRELLLHRPDYLGVIDTIAKHSNWGTPLPKGRGRGMAIVEAYGTIAGQVAEVTVSPEGKVRVDRVVASIDCYNAANPNTIAQQIESGVIWGVSAALYGEVTIKNGAPVQSNFPSYPVARMADSPRIETHLLTSGGGKWGGVGEPSAAPTAPAIANAVFAATGKRIRRLPLKNANLKLT